MSSSASSSSASAVARVATLASSSVLHVERNADVSPFKQGLQSASSFTADSAPVLSVQSHTDPASRLSSIIRKSDDASLISLLAQTDSHLLTSFVPQLANIVSKPVVLHIATSGDQSDVIALRSSGLVILYSSTPTQAHDHALLASRLAYSRSTAVLHFFENVEGNVDEEITTADIRSLLQKGSSSQAGLTNGASNGNGVNGHDAVNGSANGAKENGSSHSQPPATPEDLSRAIDESFKTVSEVVGRKLEPFSFFGSENAKDLAVVLGPGAKSLASDKLAVINVNLVRPLVDEAFRSLLPSSIEKVATLDQSTRRSTKISPLFVDVATSFQRAKAMESVPSSEQSQSVQLPKVLISGTLGSLGKKAAQKAASAVLSALEAGKNNFVIGKEVETDAAITQKAAALNLAKPPKHEEAYQVILDQLFQKRLSVVNSPLNETDPSPAARTPEYAFGQVVAQLEGRDSFDQVAREVLRGNTAALPADLSSALKSYTQEGKRGDAEIEKIQTLLSQQKNTSSAALKKLVSLAGSIDGKSRWIIGSDAWAYDVGMGGVHHVIASGKNVNMLVFDSLPYTQRDAVEAEKRKKDIGLYAMNYGNVYVASTAVYSNYTQVLQALMEADRFDGPSVVLAYVPFLTQDAPALDVLRETKLAVDSGYWPLYRWDPSAEKKGEDVFRLDSSRIREQLKDFLDRQNHLTLLANAKPELAYDLVSSQGTGLRERQRTKAKEAYDALLGAMDGPPLLILYASDGGNAEKVAKKLGTRAKARGLAARVLTMDDFPVTDELKGEKNVAFITSTAGQGEAPQNGRETMKTLNKFTEGSLKAANEDDTMRFTVFAMGDSHYWPRPEDAHYYNKPGKDLDARLDVLGAQRLAPIGLGDDQDADGYQTGYKIWEPLLWKALGVDSIEITEAEPEPITNENIKIASNYLRGTIVEGLADKSTGALADSDGQLTKFHGTYQQFDRDTVEERKAAGLEPAYSFMIRCRIPAGVVTPAQWVQLDKVAGDYGNQTMKITTRQTIQYHCVVKSELKLAMQGINKAMLDTIAACGDVNRNVMCSPNPHLSNLHAEVFEFSKGISEYLLPRMDAYHEIWLDKETESKKQLLMGGALRDYEPLYGPYYLPRKFKIAIAVPPRNDTDCFAHDIGLIAIANNRGHLVGFNVSVGGGMGVTHGTKITYPRLGDVIGFATTEQVKDVCKEIMLTQRDFGNRTNRKQARLKYTIDNHFKGPDNFRTEVERRLGYKLEAARPYEFKANTDEYGWRKQQNGNWTCMLWLENGRIRDAPGEPFRTGVRELCLADWFDGELRMTPNQHLALCEIKPSIKEKVEAHLEMYNMVLWKQSAIATSASSCVAFPTCGLAMAESERVLFPDLVEKLDAIVKRLGLASEEIITRMTGCPNGCARPWVAHIAFVGKAPETYLMLLGGNKKGTRINKVYAESVTLPEAIKLLEPILERFAAERGPDEDFGDFMIRAGIIAETKQGKDFWDSIRPLPLPVLATSG
ncbi:putative sulfite reductase cys-4 [Meira miltonrushii]|uniref:assimilatory sulfite reductase (NADPH) n=1 Tax=Meira miltonrushii TaxID=1280837 RepID=A0A316V381_9BASI|nr:putative sulfite reductase cys-4 [Meira miltonrushii]PWN32017.1 putative sulfite reductase cys-4 [Meira miltonrushii]